MTKITNNENMRRYVHSALSKQASGGGLSPEQIQELIDAAIPQWIKNIPVITEDISNGQVEITLQRFNTISNSGAVVFNDSIYTMVADHDIAMSIVENSIALDNIRYAYVFLVSIKHQTDSNEPVAEYSAIYVYESTTDPTKYYIAQSEY